MKKKILVIGIVGMFLLLSCAPFSAVGQKVKANEKAVANVDDLPDLTVDPIITTTPLVFRVNALIHNIGTAPVPSGTQYNWKIKVAGESEENHITMRLNIPLEPGDTILGLPEELALIYLKIYHGREVTVIVDTMNQINESNEQNNFDTGAFPNSISLNSMFSMLEIFPIFERLLNRLN